MDAPSAKMVQKRGQVGQAHLLARGFASIFDGESLDGREAWKISEGEITGDATDEELTP